MGAGAGELPQPQATLRSRQAAVMLVPFRTAESIASWRGISLGPFEYVYSSPTLLSATGARPFENRVPRTPQTSLAICRRRRPAGYRGQVGRGRQAQQVHD